MKYHWFEQGAFATKRARRYLEQVFSPKEVTRIAVFRHAALGDQVILRPFLIEARKFFPNALITLVGVSNYQYGAPCDLVDKTIFMAGREQKSQLSLKERLADFRQLEEQDIIFDLAGTNRSYWMTLFSKAKLKIGFPYRPYLWRTLYNVAVFRSDFEPELEVMLDTLKLLGHNPQRPLDFGYPCHRHCFDAHAENPQLLYFNGASKPDKILPKAQMKQLIEQAIERFPNYQHIYLEGQKEDEKGDYLSELSRYAQFSILPCLPLEQLVERMAQARLLISPDTGVRNVAVATYTPTIGLFYSTVPFRYTPLDGDHRIVMNADGAIPTNPQILSELSAALAK